MGKSLCLLCITNIDTVIVYRFPPTRPLYWILFFWPWDRFKLIGQSKHFARDKRKHGQWRATSVRLLCSDWPVQEGRVLPINLNYSVACEQPQSACVHL